MCLPFCRKLKTASYMKPTHQYHRLDSCPQTPILTSQPPRQAAMGPPPTISPVGAAGYSHLSTQHERLMLELLPFKDASKFHEWLQSSPVRGCWAEFCRDFLARLPNAPEPDKARTAQVAKDAIGSRSAKFMVYHPDKTGWAAEDHHVRFIVEIVSDNMMKGLWSESEWKKRGLDIAKAVYEVLSFLRSTHLVVDSNPPGYSA